MSEVELIESAMACHSEGKLREADALYGEFLEIHPQHPDALHLKGVALFQLGDAAHAEPLIKKAISINSREPDYHSNLGLVLQSLGKHREALDSYRGAVALKPDFREALISLARLELKLNLSASAAATFRKIVGKDETDTNLLREFVAALIENGELPEAERLCRQTLALDPTNVDSIVSLGHLQQVMKLPDEAEKTYRAALQRDPNNVRATNNIGTVLMMREQPEVALEWFLKAVRLDNSFVEAFFNAGIAYKDIGDLDSAENYFNAAIARNNDLPRAYRYLSEIYRARGKRDLQQKTLKAWLDVSPESATAKHLLAASQGESSVLRASDDFVREEFDDFADTFDEKLEKLEYTTPTKLIDLLDRQDIAPNSIDRALDAGCGTGLCGRGIAGFANTIVGVDLSGKMLEQAMRLNVYTELVEHELVAYMCSQPEAFDLVVSADTLPYFGDLESVVVAARRTLSPRGLFAFSVERMQESEKGNYRLQSSGRYCHAARYVESCLLSAGFRVAAAEETPIRLEASKPVLGILYVAKLDEGGGK
jgi:predicted TPR repeat methyltransferase